jgi:hypothetical protein
MSAHPSLPQINFRLIEILPLQARFHFYQTDFELVWLWLS